MRGKLTIGKYLKLYLLFCIIGPLLEWVYGALWDIIGGSPWIYPGSPFYYTSLWVVPIWGFGGLIAVILYKLVIEKDYSYLKHLPIILCLDAIVVIILAIIR